MVSIIKTKITIETNLFIIIVIILLILRLHHQHYITFKNLQIDLEHINQIHLCHHLILMSLVNQQEKEIILNFKMNFN